MSAVRKMIVARAIERNESEKQTLRFSEIFYGLAEATFDFTIALNVASRAIENPPNIRFGK